VHLQRNGRPKIENIAIWPFHWVLDMPGALQSTYISENQFPKVFAWIARFRDALRQARAAGPKPAKVSIEEVITYMGRSRFYEPVGEVDAHDPTALKGGDEVTAWPTDTGTSNRDTGKLVALTPHDIVISKRTKVDDLEIHIHMPRWGFRVVQAKPAKPASAKM
jgi:hypothetical protein